MLALQCAVPDRYAKVFEARRAQPTARIEEVEQRILGFTHARVGSELLRQLGNPRRSVRPDPLPPRPGKRQGAGRRAVHPPAGAGALAFARRYRICSRAKPGGIIRITIAGEAQEQFNLTRTRRRIGSVTRDVRHFSDLFNLGPQQDPVVRRGPPKAERELTNLAIELEWPRAGR